MPQLRKDPVVGGWVIIAPERADRPSAFLRPAPEHEEGICPFCPGNESLTPPAILTRKEESGAWSLRVVANRYPALRTEIHLTRTGQGMFDAMAGVGAHEVVIETNDHAKGLADLAVEGVEQIFQAWKERIQDLAGDIRLKAIVVFKNHGGPAGATLRHAHSQLIALPFIPEGLSDELGAARRHFEEKERCIYCDVIAQELAQRERVVLETDGVVVFSPFAARSPFELWILPREHRSSFESAPPPERRAAADALRAILRKIDIALEKPAYNLFLHTMPLRESANDFYHWHLTLKPVLTLQGGFEWSTGCFINPTPPEEAALFLRQTEVFP
jgi:UDPglucose--hexose-1-phosphate uridylyltransferase